MVMIYFSIFNLLSKFTPDKFFKFELRIIVSEVRYLIGTRKEMAFIEDGFYFVLGKPSK